MLNISIRAIYSLSASAVVLAAGLLAPGAAGAQSYPLTARAAGIAIQPPKMAAPSLASQVAAQGAGPTCGEGGDWANQIGDPSNTFDGIASVQYGSDWRQYVSEAVDDFVVPACDFVQRFYGLVFYGYRSAPRGEGYPHVQSMSVSIYKDAGGKPGELFWQMSPQKRYSGGTGIWFEEDAYAENSRLMVGCGGTDGDSNCNHEGPLFPPSRKATRYWISVQPYLISENFEEGSPETTGPWFWALRREVQKPYFAGASGQWRGGDQLVDQDGNANNCTDWARLDECAALGLKKKYELQMGISGGVVGSDTARANKPRKP